MCAEERSAVEAPAHTDKRLSWYEDCLQRPDRSFPDFDVTTTRLLLTLLLTYDAVETYLSRSLAPSGLSRSAYNLLMILKMSEGGRPLHEIGELLLTSRANVTGLVDCLEHKNLVQRVPDKTDRRSRLAVITPEGEALLQDVTPSHRSRMGDIVTCLSEDEKQQLTGLLARLRDHVSTRQSTGHALPGSPPGGQDPPVCS